MSEDPQGIERRQYVRIKKNYIIRFSGKENPSLKYEVSQIENISKGGICFTSTIRFEEGVELAIELRTPYITDTIYLQGKVLDSIEKVKGLIFQNRLQFHDVDPRALEVLNKIEKYNTNQKAF